jgi:glutamate dehydrogenase
VWSCHEVARRGTSLEATRPEGEVLDPDRRADAHAQILAAVSARHHPDPAVRDDFAAAILRRLDTAQLAVLDPGSVARWLTATLTRIASQDPDALQVVVDRPPVGLDGRRPGPMTVDVVCEDRPFLLSTVTDELRRSGFTITRSWHPVVGIERDAHGDLGAIVPARTAHERRAILHLELAGDPDADLERLAARLRDLIADVVRATTDFEAMHARLADLATELRFADWAGGDDPWAQEVADFIDWLLDENLVILGVREYQTSGDPPVLQVVPDSGLGLLRDTSTSRFAEPVPIDRLEPAMRLHLSTPQLLIVSRTRRESTVQRRDRMQSILVTREVDGHVHEVRVLGLFTRRALGEAVETTPVLRERLRHILEREDVVPGSHDEAALTSLLQSLPKDELFAVGIDELHRMLVELRDAEEHGEVRTLVREDPRSRSVSVVVTIPRDRYGPQMRERMQGHLVRRFGASRIDAEVALGDRRDALVRFLLHVDEQPPEVDQALLRAEMAAIARSWLDDVLEQLAEGNPEDVAASREIATLLPAGYRDTIAVEDAVRDVELLRRLRAEDVPVLVEIRPGAGPHTPRVRVAKRDDPLELSGFLPMLESLGLTVVEEIPHQIASEPRMHLHDFGVRVDGVDPERDGPRIANTIIAAWRGHLEVDSLNALVVVAGFDWREVTILRAYRRLRRQLGTTYTPEYVNTSIVGNPEVARALIEHFRARFDPALADDPDAAGSARERALAACDALARLDHDRILRGALELIDATVRTNAFRADAIADGSGEPYLALKLDSSRIADVPAPAPYRETFVHSPRVEGVHLRFGPVSRGGLRWSDRRDDVRAEVFGLVRAQLLKNAFIVPTGAKGGFVLKAEPDDPTAVRDEVRRQYVTFVRALLDVTDDLDGDVVVPPEGVRRHDGDDPYLVVAADRGTATLSDTANAIARRYGYWLDDAFASGGSNGYDHKVLGVTARGAWLAVRRHFFELGIDVQADPVTVAGVGDMSGDVFGNGLLQSRTVRLVAAFDHRDIFLDPDPDPERAYEERARLFALPRSSWQDYDRARISDGGGVFARSSRTVPLSDQVREMLRLDAAALTPPELIRAILQAPVDLLFAGGIGTYVKAAAEVHGDVDDRANDELRVDARDLRARVIGEGANLFVTQRGRIEYARRGGRINQDAIDNAAGVATSDVEVNLKILLTLAQDRGVIKPDERDAILSELADDAVAHVMAAVDRQAAALSREAERSPSQLAAYDRMMRRLATSHALDREVEALPDRRAIADRDEAGAGLTRPELATLQAWSKRELKEQLLAWDGIDRPLFAPAVSIPFPASAAERFHELLPEHRLRRELIATAVANDVVDRMGITYVAETADVAGVDPTTVVTAYWIARDALDADRYFTAADLTDHEPARRRELAATIEQTVAGVTAGLVDRTETERDPESVAVQLGEVVQEIAEPVFDLGNTDQRRARQAHARWLMDDLVEPELARFLASGPDLVLVPQAAEAIALLGDSRQATATLDCLLRIGAALGIERLEELLARVRPTDPWAQRQRDGIAADLRRARRIAAVAALAGGPRLEVTEAVERFLADQGHARARIQRVLDEASAGDGPVLDAIAVAARTVRAAVDAV